MSEQTVIELRRRDLLVVAGLPGAGKTTMLRHAAGALPVLDSDDVRASLSAALPAAMPYRCYRLLVHAWHRCRIVARSLRTDGPVVVHEPMRGRDAVAIAVALAGMALFFVGRFEARGMAGNAMALLSSVFFALLILSLRREQQSAQAAVTWGNLACAAATLPFVWRDLALTPWVKIASNGVLYQTRFADGGREIDYRYLKDGAWSAWTLVTTFVHA